MKLYFAYGANTNHRGMTNRAPASIFLGTAALDNYRLAFRGVADVIKAEGEAVRGAVWALSDECERALDLFEGVAHGLYFKRALPIRMIRPRSKLIAKTLPRGDVSHALVYVMNAKRAGFSAPPVSYENCLRAGYASCRLPASQIDEAIEFSISRQPKSIARAWNGSWR